MTRTTCEAAVLLRLPWFSDLTVEELESDQWMCEALTEPCPRVRLASVLMDVIDVLDFPDAYDDERVSLSVRRLDHGLAVIESWFKSTIAGNARVELTAEDLWALFRLVRVVSTRYVPFPFDPCPPRADREAWTATVLGDDDPVPALSAGG